MRSLLNRVFHSRLLFAFTLTIIFYGLFLIPNDGQSNRVWNQINNLGHIAAFLIIWTFIFNFFPQLMRLSTWQLLAVVMVMTFAVAELIEIIQGWIGRDDELQDVWDSGVGGLLAITFCSPQVRSLTRSARAAWRGLALIMLVIVPWTIWSNLADEVILRRQFPVLSDFSSPFEYSRWHADMATIQLQYIQETRRRVLAIDFHPVEYSTVSLQYFYPDWRGYRDIVLDVTNPDTTVLNMVVRLHDRLHAQHHFAFTDRFNRALVIKPGRQQIIIRLAEVKNAPASRQMDLAHMQNLSIFTMNAKTDYHLFINKVYLE